MRCPKCKRDAPKLHFVIREKKSLWLCNDCDRAFMPKKTYTGRKVWAGHEVYGKKYGSDELREDTERAMLGGRGAGLKG